VKKAIVILLIFLIISFCGLTVANSSRRELNIVPIEDVSSDVPAFMIIHVQKKHESLEQVEDPNKAVSTRVVSVEQGIYRPGYAYEETDTVVITETLHKNK